MRKLQEALLNDRQQNANIKTNFKNPQKMRSYYHIRNEKVRGSTPLGSTIPIFGLQPSCSLMVLFRTGDWLESSAGEKPFTCLRLPDKGNCIHYAY